MLDGSSQKTSSSSMDGTRVCGGRTSRPPPNPHASENTPEAAQRGYLRLLNDGGSISLSGSPSSASSPHRTFSAPVSPETHQRQPNPSQPPKPLAPALAGADLSSSGTHVCRHPSRAHLPAAAWLWACHHDPDRRPVVRVWWWGEGGGRGCGVRRRIFANPRCESELRIRVANPSCES